MAGDSEQHKKGDSEQKTRTLSLCPLAAVQCDQLPCVATAMRSYCHALPATMGSVVKIKLASLRHIGQAFCYSNEKSKDHTCLSEICQGQLKAKELSHLMRKGWFR